MKNISLSDLQVLNLKTKKTKQQKQQQKRFWPFPRPSRNCLTGRLFLFFGGFLTRTAALR